MMDNGLGKLPQTPSSEEVDVTIRSTGNSDRNTPDEITVGDAPGPLNMSTRLCDACGLALLLQRLGLLLAVGWPLACPRTARPGNQRAQLCLFCSVVIFFPGLRNNSKQKSQVT